MKNMVNIYSLLLIFFTTNFLSAQWYSNWGYRKAITNNLALAGDLTNFPLLVTISNDSDLAAYASNNGYDIIFTLITNTNKLAHEIEYFSAGTLIAWVKIPLYSASEQASNNLFMYFDKTKTGNQQNPEYVWRDNYAAVWHLNQDPSVSQQSNSATNAFHSSAYVAMDASSVVPGQIGSALGFNGIYNTATGSSITIPSELTNHTSGPLSVTAWARSTNFPVTYGRVVISGYNRNGGTNAVGGGIVMTNERGWYLGYVYGSANNLNFAIYSDVGVSKSAAYSTFHSAYQNTWAHVAGVFEPSVYVREYCNGNQVAVTTSSIPAFIGQSNQSIRIGQRSDNTTQAHWAGFIDEVRVARTVLSSNWIVNECTNQINPVACRIIGALEEYGVPAVSVSAVNTPPAIAGQSASFLVTADTSGTGTITNLLINYGDNTSANYVVNASSVTGTYSHTYTSGNTFLLKVSATSDANKTRTNQIYITPAPYAMPGASNIQIFYMNNGLKFTFNMPSVNINRAVIYRDSLQLASISPVSAEMEFTDNYLLYHTVYSYQIGAEYGAGMVLSVSISNLPLQPELAQKTIGIKGGTVANLIAELDIPAGALQQDTLVSMTVYTNLLYNFQPGYGPAYNQINIETRPAQHFTSNVRLTLRVPFFNNKIRMVPDDNKYNIIFEGCENLLTMSSYSEAGTWVPVYSRVSDKSVLPNFSYKLLAADISDTGKFGVSIIANVGDYNNKPVVKNRVFAPWSGYSSLASVMIFFPNPAYEDVLFQIYRMDGKKVHERYFPGAVTLVSWDGINNSGKMSDSGLYITVITIGGKIKEAHRANIYLLK